MNENRMGRTELESVKRYLEEKREASKLVDEFPQEFFLDLILRGLRLDLIEPGRIVFSMNIPRRLLVRILPALFIFLCFSFPDILFFYLN